MERVQSVRSFKIVQNYHHSDFMYARNAKELVFKDILKFIQANSIQ